VHEFWLRIQPRKQTQRIIEKPEKWQRYYLQEVRMTLTVQTNESMVENMLAQADSLRAVVDHQYGAGRGPLLKAGELLRSSRQIVLSGMGTSLHACYPLADFLASRGVATPVVETAELLHFQANLLNPDTTVVLVSRSGENAETIKLLPILRQRYCKVIGVVNAPESSLAREATHTILVNSLPDQLVAIQSYTGTLAALALLGAAFASEFEGSVKTDLEAAASALAHCVPDWFRFSGSWPGFFAHGVPLYILGRGPSLASAQVGAFLFQKVAKMPAIAMSAAQFRHGAVEVVNDRFRAVILGSQRAMADMDADLAEKLIQMEGNVRWIGPDPGRPGVVPLCDWAADIPERFAHLFDIIPLQMAAYHTAQWQGFTAGQLKFAAP
jgi:glucosamine--fructose-6-phosphate aminotransferase (isomerizing)